MLAALAVGADYDRPLEQLRLAEVDPPEPLPHWSVVEVAAATLNHHDLWSLRGVVFPPERLPMVLGTDAAGTTADGEEVVVHAVIGDGRGVGPDEPRSLLSERYPGTLAQQVAVPTWNLLTKPPELSFAEAACLPTAWLTAYRMLYRSAGLTPGQRVLVQGAGGGVATAAIQLGVAGGLEVAVTSRDPAKRERARELGAAVVLEPGRRLPNRVDAVIETVGEATWAHSLRAVRPGGTVVVAGSTTGGGPPAELSRVSGNEITVVGVMMGSREDLVALIRLCASGVHPVIDSTFPLPEVHQAFARLASGAAFGKIVVTP